MQAANRLERVIAREIHAQGAIPFSRFMQLALYHPAYGYYQKAVIGKAGDFYTNVSIGSLFGELLAFQFGHWRAGVPPPWHWLEAGAHDGRLACDILEALQARAPEIFSRVQYTILEPIPARRRLQAARLGSRAAQVRWIGRWTDLPRQSIRGVIFSNELLDAFPVHRLGWDAPSRSWFEWAVSGGAGSFRWVRRPVSRVAAGFRRAGGGAETVRRFESVLPDQYTIEYCPAARRWWRAAADRLQSGYLLTFDYGLTSEEIWSPHRTRGTLRGYRHQAQVQDVLAAVGETDLTAHVNFTLLERAGVAAGLEMLGLFRQSEFLTKTLELAEQSNVPLARSSAAARQFQTLTHPDQLGSAFRVLVQGRR